MRTAVVVFALALLLGASAALAQENNTSSPSPSPNATASPSPSPAPSPTPNATASPAPQTGRLKIITTPVDGDILLDRAVVGTGLYVNDTYPAGSYRLEFGFVKGYTAPLSRVVIVEPGKLNSFFGEYISRAATAPRVTVAREVAPTSLSTGDTVNVILRLANEGTANAVNVSLVDAPPACVSGATGETRWNGTLAPAERKRLTYTATAAKGGLCIFESPRVAYEGEDGTAYRATAEDASISIAAKAEPEPKLLVDKSAKSEASVAENIVITTKLQNVGNAPALRVRMNDTVPDCAKVVNGDTTFAGDIPAGEARTVFYEVELKKPGPCLFDVSRASYEGPGGKTYQASASGQVNVLVKEKAFAETLESLTKPITVIAGAIGAIIFIFTLVKKTHSKAAEKVTERKKKE